MQRKTERAAALPRGKPCETDHAVEPISFTNKLELRPGQLIDRYGHVHSEAVFKNWSPAAIRALGIRRVKAEGGGR
jgi:hypothetical protein